MKYVAGKWEAGSDEEQAAIDAIHAEKAAALIAAAPELLEACQRLLRQYEITSPKYMGVEAVAVCRAAIAKAGGR
jgi:hypothetical protein